MNKILLYTFALCLVLNSVVDSCQSNSAASSYCVGAFSDSCNDQCRCNATSLLTCIDFKCGCNLASLGDLESTCNDICQCKTNTGLSCFNSRCSCNTTTQVWDTIKCYNTESTTTNCDKLIQATPNFVSGSSSAFTATTKAGWRCSTITGAIYSPSYNQSTKLGKYIVVLTAQSSSQATSDCKSRGASRIMPKDSDEIVTLLKKYQSLSFMIGAFIDPRDGAAYLDGGEKLSSSYYTASGTPGSTGYCLKLTTSSAGAVTIVEHACNTALSYICQY